MDKAASTRKMATAFSKRGWVTVCECLGQVTVFSYGTHSGHDDIGKLANKEHFATLANAAKAELLN